MDVIHIFKTRITSSKKITKLHIKRKHLKKKERKKENRRNATVFSHDSLNRKMPHTPTVALSKQTNTAKIQVTHKRSICSKEAQLITNSHDQYLPPGVKT